MAFSIVQAVGGMFASIVGWVDTLLNETGMIALYLTCGGMFFASVILLGPMLAGPNSDKARKSGDGDG